MRDRSAGSIRFGDPGRIGRRAIGQGIAVCGALYQAEIERSAHVLGRDAVAGGDIAFPVPAQFITAYQRGKVGCCGHLDAHGRRKRGRRLYIEQDVREVLQGERGATEPGLCRRPGLLVAVVVCIRPLRHLLFCIGEAAIG